VPQGCQSDQACGNFQCPSGACVTCEGGACALPAPRFLELLTETGVFGSICEDYADVLGSLGFEAAGLARKFALTKHPDCAKTVPCCESGVPDAQCTEKKPMCVRVDGAVIPNERATGWVYDASGNSVFFDGGYVPPTGATVSISYTRAPGEMALSCDVNVQ
jgi:hypothetical protein